MFVCSSTEAEVLSSLTLQHHHWGAEGSERYRGVDWWGWGWELHPFRVHECLSYIQQLWDPQAGPEAYQDGRKCKLKSTSAQQFKLLNLLCLLELRGQFLYAVQVYLAAGAVYGLEGALGELEQCARSINCTTTDTELAFLEDQVATAAAQVQQSELQVLKGITDYLNNFSSELIVQCVWINTEGEIKVQDKRSGCGSVLVFLYTFLFVHEGIKHWVQDLSSENSWVKCDCLQSLLKVQAKVQGTSPSSHILHYIRFYV